MPGIKLIEKHVPYSDMSPEVTDYVHRISFRFTECNQITIRHQKKNENKLPELWSFSTEVHSFITLESILYITNILQLQVWVEAGAKLLIVLPGTKTQFGSPQKPF